MQLFKKSILVSTILFISPLYALPVFSSGNGQSAKETTLSVDFNEETHMVFMREEEKLARDVYISLGDLYPDAIVFSNIDDAEQQHTTTVKEKLAKYNIADPNTDDTVGAFTGEDYGWYFTEKYTLLVSLGEKSELDALYVGAFIEELDMLDIVQCPKVIVETQDKIKDSGDCGLNYTDNHDLQSMLESLLEGSKNHLRSYVGNIEAVKGVCSYEAQVLTQLEVDTILGRVGECGDDYE
jgi:hypothetical protein